MERQAGNKLQARNLSKEKISEGGCNLYSVSIKNTTLYHPEQGGTSMTIKRLNSN
jgi:hypothetical protein